MASVRVDEILERASAYVKQGIVGDSLRFRIATFGFDIAEEGVHAFHRLWIDVSLEELQLVFLLEESIVRICRSTGVESIEQSNARLRMISDDLCRAFDAGGGVSRSSFELLG